MSKVSVMLHVGMVLSVVLLAMPAAAGYIADKVKVVTADKFGGWASCPRIAFTPTIVKKGRK